jgi:purine-binding chemotaxis protein CheW
MSSLHVLFEVAGTEYVLPASDVLQMETYEGATEVPGALPHVVGIVQIRGQVIPIVDVRTRFGLEPAKVGGDRRIVVVQQGSRIVGLLVDRAREVIHLEPDVFQAPPDVLVEQSAGYVKSVAQTGKRMVLLMDFPKVIGQEEVNGGISLEQR